MNSIDANKFQESIVLNEQKFCIHHAKNGDCNFDKNQLLKAIK